MDELSLGNRITLGYPADLSFADGMHRLPFGVFSVAHAVCRLRNGGKRKAYVQVRPYEIEACSFSVVPNPQRFDKEIAHENILLQKLHVD
jgi:hypothetical protein